MPGRTFRVACRPLSMEAILLNVETPGWLGEKEAIPLREGMVFDTFKPRYILSLLDFPKREFPGDWQCQARESMIRITEDPLFDLHSRGMHRSAAPGRDASRENRTVACSCDGCASRVLI